MRRDPWRRFLLRLCRELGVATPRLLLQQVTSRELSEWEAYFQLLDAPAPMPAPPAPRLGDDPDLSWQRLLSFADRVNTARS